jgi:hypothetical protein
MRAQNRSLGAAAKVIAVYSSREGCAVAAVDYTAAAACRGQWFFAHRVQRTACERHELIGV